MTPRAQPVSTDRWVLVSLALAMLLPSLGTSIANVALPAFAESFGGSFGAVQWVVLAYLIANTTLVVSAGRLGDMVGYRRLLLAGIQLFMVASVACALAPSLPVLIGARALQGAGAAVMLALSMAIATEAVPEARIGTTLGMLGSMSAIGTALGPALGGLLLARFGWPSIFLINVPLGLVAYVLARRSVPVDGVSTFAKVTAFDFPGTFLLAIALGAYALAATAGGAQLGAYGPALWLLALGAVAALVLLEGRVANPLIRLAVLRESGRPTGLAMSSLVAAVLMATLVVGPFYLSHALGLSSAQVGLAMSVGPLVAALSAAPAGRLVDRIGAGPATAAGLVCIAAGAVLLAMMPTASGVPGYLTAMILLTAGYATFQTANNTAIMAKVMSGHRGVVSGLLNLSRNLGLISGTAVMGAVFAHATGTVEITAASPEAIAEGMRGTFSVAVLLVVLVLVLSGQLGALKGLRCSWRDCSDPEEETGG